MLSVCAVVQIFTEQFLAGNDLPPTHGSRLLGQRLRDAASESPLAVKVEVLSFGPPSRAVIFGESRSRNIG
jgi:hypothetical protein